MSYVMSINVEDLKESYSVQKDVKLENLLLYNTSFIDFSTAEETAKKQWRPLSFATTVRSINTNRVVCLEDQYRRRKIAYHTFTDVEKMIHKGYDLVMFLASQSFLSLVDGGSIDVQSAMSEGSTFQCQGLYYDGLLDPIVYSQVIISDDVFPSLAKWYKIGVCDESISDLKNKFSNGNIPALLDDIIEVKGV